MYRKEHFTENLLYLPHIIAGNTIVMCTATHSHQHSEWSRASATLALWRESQKSDPMWSCNANLAVPKLRRSSSWIFEGNPPRVAPDSGSEVFPRNKGKCLIGFYLCLISFYCFLVGFCRFKIVFFISFLIFLIDFSFYSSSRVCTYLQAHTRTHTHTHQIWKKWCTDFSQGLQH